MRSRTGSQGFSLAELIVSILILASLSVILVGVIPSAIFGTKSAENRAQAACIAHEAMERLRTRAFDTLASSDQEPRTSNGTVFNVRLEVGPVVQPPATWNEARAKDVRVIVTWRDRVGWKSDADNQTYAARTIFYNN